MTLKDFVKNKEWKKWRKDQWLIVFLAGVLILVIAMPAGNKKEDTKELSVQTEELSSEKTASYEKQLEDRLKEILETVEGAGKVQVMITLKDNGESIVEKDVESSYSTNGNIESEESEQTIQRQTSETTVYENQTEEAGPFVTKENTPEVEGVLVVAQGGGNAVVVQNISEAIQALFDIEIHKIKIVKMNAQEGIN